MRLLRLRLLCLLRTRRLRRLRRSLPGALQRCAAAGTWPHDSARLRMRTVPHSCAGLRCFSAPQALQHSFPTGRRPSDARL